jgi:GH24 family phage-related lysozyme (muramidase)
MSRLIISEEEVLRIKNLYQINEQLEEMVYWYEDSRSAGQPIFDYIRKWEKFIPYVYDDGVFPTEPYDPNSGRPKGTLTIGYGTTNPDIIEKYLNKMSQSEAKRLSAIDINDAANCIKRWQEDFEDTDKNHRRLTKGMYMAMIDMAYNMGCSGLRNSSIVSDIEKGDYKSAANKIENGDWGHDERREETRKLFCQNNIC